MVTCSFVRNYPHVDTCRYFSFLFTRKKVSSICDLASLLIDIKNGKVCVNDGDSHSNLKSFYSSNSVAMQVKRTVDVIND